MVVLPLVLSGTLAGQTRVTTVRYSLPCLVPLICILTYLICGGVLSNSHITSHLHSSSEGGCQLGVNHISPLHSSSWNDHL
jgi:hypothetical protein